MATDNSQPSKRAQMIDILKQIKRYGKKVVKNIPKKPKNPLTR